MQKIIGCMILISACSCVYAQELFVSTEPASNMAAGSIGFRLNNKLFKMPEDGSHAYRLDPEIMFGISKKLMIHLNMYGSNMYQPDFRPEGGGMYGKYRFFSSDDIHSHFRIAAYGRFSLISNPVILEKEKTSFFTGTNGQIELLHETNYYHSDEIDIEGNNSGFMAGVVATQLAYKLAFSSSVAVLNRWDNLNTGKLQGQSATAIDYTVSGGYLFLPRTYRDFRQTNVNLYCELIASTALDKKAYFIDLAPALQFIFNSISRVDISYQTQITGNMQRLSENYFLLRFEYNLLNIFKNR